jgi:hypothetical protein
MKTYRPDLAPILVRDDEAVDLREAAAFASSSTDTIRRWCKLYLIARPSRGNAPLMIHKAGISAIMHGDFVALELLRAGNYADERLIRHYEFAGIPLPPDDDGAYRLIKARLQSRFASGPL